MLYQLSYASPSHPETFPEMPKYARGHTPTSHVHGTEIKVSTPLANGANRSEIAACFRLKDTGLGPYINPAKSTQESTSGGNSFKMTRYAESNLAPRAFHFNSIVSYAA